MTPKKILSIFALFFIKLPALYPMQEIELQTIKQPKQHTLLNIGNSHNLALTCYSLQAKSLEKTLQCIESKKNNITELRILLLKQLPQTLNHHVLQLFKELHNIKHVHISIVKTTVEKKIFDQFKRIKKLKTLFIFLNTNQPNREQLKILNVILALEKLQYLTLRGFRKIKKVKFASNSKLKSLKTFISSIPFEKECLVNLLPLKNIQSAYLSWNNDLDGLDLPYFAKYKNLEKLAIQTKYGSSKVNYKDKVNLFRELSKLHTLIINLRITTRSILTSE